MDPWRLEGTTVEDSLESKLESGESTGEAEGISFDQEFYDRTTDSSAGSEDCGRSSKILGDNYGILKCKIIVPIYILIVLGKMRN